MENTFEVQLIDSLRNVNRKHSRIESSTSLLNRTVLVIGFISLALGYTMNSISPEIAVQVLNDTATERSEWTTSLTRHLTQISQSIGELLDS